jgi:hypothetical protein
MRHVFQLKRATMYVSINSSIKWRWVYISLGGLFLSFTTMGHCSGQGWLVNAGHETCLPAEKSQNVCKHQQLNKMQFGVFFCFYTTMGRCSGQGWIVNTAQETSLRAKKGHHFCQHQQLNTMQFGVFKPWCFVNFLYDHGPLFGSRLNSDNWPWDMSSSWK